jgi:hypothetical protein
MSISTSGWMRGISFVSASDTRKARGRHTCSETGFTLVPAARREVYRLAKTSYGPLNPLYRDPGSADRDAWNRYDVAGQRTVYAASTEEGAYGELLAALKPKLPARASTYFDDVSDDDELHTLIREEWRSAGYRAPGEIDLMWLTEYKLYRLTLPAKGWFIDIETATSLTAIATHAPLALIDRGLTGITVAELRGPDRVLTTAIASRIWQLTLGDDTLSHGITYGSRYGSDWNCWAIWLRRSTGIHNPKNPITTADTGTDVLQPALNPALENILSTYRLTATWH